MGQVPPDRALLRFILSLLVVTLAACATAGRPPGRLPSDEEVRVLEQAIRPLLEELDYPWPRTSTDCRVGLTIWQSSAINASIGPGRSAAPCQYFLLGVTEGALSRLPVDMLRAILAHELGHLRVRPVQDEPGSPAILRPITRAFSQREETEADRFAVSLLRRIEPRYPGACMALVYVFGVLEEQQAGGRVPWLAAHPSSARRGETALTECKR